MMAEAKSRHVDYYSDEYIAGVAAKLPYDEQGMYWMICSLIMSYGGPIENDIDHLARLGCLSKTKARNLLAKLIKRGKIIENDGVLSQKRAENEVEKAIKRIEIAQNNGSKGGRPTNENKDLTKPAGLSAEKLTTNHQPPTTNQDTCDEFINLYPKKVNKEKTDQAIRLLESCGEDHKTIIGALKVWCEYWRLEKTPNQYIPLPTTWIKEQRWLDKPKLKPTELDRFLNS